jgi:hypothetical protein
MDRILIPEGFYKEERIHRMAHNKRVSQELE